MSQLPVQPEPVNRDVAVAQAQNLGAGMKQQGIKAIEFENGTRAEYDSKTDTTTVAGNGTIVKDTPLTTTVTTIKPGVDPVDATKEVYGSGNKQVITAAAQNTSQPVISGQLSK
ncbi:TPA: hypothetical protein NJ597_004618 [Vibrio parahaemolyticus]|nr:hypothetical protein [Vibrio parahaemolyticus]HCG9162787.1 hypothetical protein [Vibrio parahaemolyticus]